MAIGRAGCSLVDVDLQRGKGRQDATSDSTTVMANPIFLIPCLPYLLPHHVARIKNEGDVVPLVVPVGSESQC